MNGYFCLKTNYYSMRNYLIIGIIVAIVVFLVFMIYFTEKPVKKLTGLEIANMSYGFFDKMRRSNEWYNYSQTCKEEFPLTNCKIDSNSYPQTNAWVMLANLGLYDATKEQRHLNNAKYEMNVLLNNCKNPDDIYCLWVLVQMSELYKRAKDPDYLDKIQNFADKLLEIKTEEGVMMKGIETREFAVAFSLTGDQKYLDESLNRLKTAEEYLKSEGVLYVVNDLQVRDFVCSVELAKLELYKVTEDEKYLNDVKTFFDSADVGTHGEDLYQLTVIQPCIESLLTLYFETGDVKYWNQALNLTYYMITYRWDSPLNMAKKYNGDGGFLFQTYQNENMKTVTDTGYAIYLLSIMKDAKFEIVKWR